MAEKLKGVELVYAITAAIEAAGGDDEVAQEAVRSLIHGDTEDEDEELQEDSVSSGDMSGIQRQEFSGRKSHPLYEGKNGTHKFSSTQLDFPESMARRVLALGAMIPDADLAEDGRETVVHLTAKYGLHTENAADVRDVVSGFGAINVRLGKTKIFAGDDFDVVYVSVSENAEALRALNKAISDACEYTDTHPRYVPHVCLAYVKKGLGKRYAGNATFDGVPVTFDRLTFSDKSRRHTIIPLNADAGANLPLSEAKDGEDDGGSLGRMFAGILNALAYAGEDDETLADELSEELEESGWMLAKHPKGLWIATPIADDGGEDEAPEMDFLGESLGWIPERIIVGTDKRGRKYAYDTDLKKRVSLSGNVAGSAKKRLAAKHAAGHRTNRQELATKLRAHAGKKPHRSLLLDASKAARALFRHHGEYAASRIEELTDRLENVLNGLDGGGEHERRAQVVIKAKLRQLGLALESLHHVEKMGAGGGGKRLPAGKRLGTGVPPASTGEPAGTGQGAGGGTDGVLPDDDGAGDGVGDDDGESGDAAGRGAGSGAGGSAGGKRRRVNKREESLLEPPTEENPTDLSAGNWSYGTDRDFAKGGLKAKFKANVEAIKTLRAIRLDGRTTATPAEQAILSKYVGWGQMPQAFGWNYDPQWDKERQILKALLPEAEFEAARKSTMNAHYTSPDVVDAHWRMAQKMGFKGGRYLETSAGAGYYLGLMPPELAAKTRSSAVELDPTTGGILSLLYPSANVKVQGFEKFQSPNNFYDLVASNVPFGDYKVHDPEYNKHQAKIHDYFFLKSADKVRPGGIIMHITSAGTMDKQNGSIRKELAAKGMELVSAIRFPAGAHKENAGTDVVTDMLILRKKVPGEKPVHPTETPDEALPQHKSAAAGQHARAMSVDMANPDGVVDALRQAHSSGLTGETARTAAHAIYAAAGGAIPKSDFVQRSEQIEKMLRDNHGTDYGFTGITTDSLGRLYHWRDGKRVPGPRWDDLVTVPDPDGGEPIPINRYFADNPEQVLGKVDRKSTLYSDGNPNVSKTDDYEARLEAAIGRIPANVMQKNAAPKERFSPETAPAPGDVKQGGYAVKGGKLFVRDKGALIEQEIDEKTLARIAAHLTLRDAVRECINDQQAGRDATASREALNVAYDAFVKKWGFVGLPANRKAFRTDPDSFVLQALEHYDQETKKATKAAIFEKNVVGSVASVDRVSTVSEAVGVSLHETGRLDLTRMGQVLGWHPERLAKALVEGGLAYQDPTGDWLPADQYLSGNVRRKLTIARAAAETDPKFAANVTALEKVQPADVEHHEIGVKLGSSWVPPSDVAAFAGFLLEKNADTFEVGYVPGTGEWMLDFSKGGKWAKSSRLATQVWATPRTTYDQLLEAALNGRTVTVYDPPVEEGGKSTVNQEATDDANAKIEEMKDAFKEWIWEDDERRNRLHRHYNDNFNNVVKMKYDGSHQSFPGMNPAIKLREHQANFVWQVVTTGTGLAAHEVGLGKSLAMIASAMELRRLGLARKPAIACLKANVEAITQDAQHAYPGARILSTADMFDAKKRKETMSRIATGDYDLIVMTHDHLNALQMKPEVVAAHIKDEVKELEASIFEAIKDDPKKANGRAVKQMEKAKAKLEARLEKALDATTKDDAVFFEDTGIDHIFVDECFPGNTQVQTESGPMVIREIVEGKLPVRVLTCNRETGGIEYRPVTAWFARPLRNHLVRVTHSFGSFVCTPNHNVWVDGIGYVEAGKLQEHHVLELAPLEGFRNYTTVRGVAIHQRFDDAGGGEKVVYDVEVGGTHNYFADGVNVSNSHKFKTLPVYTKRDRLKGVPTGRSDRATNMLMRTRWLQEQNGGRGVVFATGTPVANTMAELYTMQRYLQPQDLKERGIQAFDAWASTFGDVETKMEFTVSGEYKPVSRFAKFTNIPELSQMTGQMMDVQRADQLRNVQKFKSEEEANAAIRKVLKQKSGTPDAAEMASRGVTLTRNDDGTFTMNAPGIIRPKRKDQVIVAPRTEATDNLMASLQERAKALKSKKPGESGDNMLVICTDGRKGALDMRLLDANAPDDPDSKVNQAVRKILELHKGDPTRSQLIFSDIGVNASDKVGKVKSGGAAEEAGEVGDDAGGEDAAADSGGVGSAVNALAGSNTSFRLYDDVINKLVKGGIPREKIADFSRLEGAKKEATMEAMRRGDVLIGIGSTEKLGTGVNVQDKLAALHHLDVPWVPASVEQRDGRGWRQGNENKEVGVYRYVSEGSLDQTFWQIIGNKTRFIKQVIHDGGQGVAREAKDEDAEELTPDQLMAAASGDPRVLEKVNVDQDLKLLKNARSRHDREQHKFKDSMRAQEAAIPGLQRKAQNHKDDAAKLAANPEFSLTVGGKTYTERPEAEAALANHIEANDDRINAASEYQPFTVGSYRGMPIKAKGGRLYLEGKERYDVNSSLKSIEANARFVPRQAEATDESIVNARADVERTKARIGAVWAKKDEYEAKAKRAAELEQELKNKGKSPEEIAAQNAALAGGVSPASGGGGSGGSSAGGGKASVDDPRHHELRDVIARASAARNAGADRQKVQKPLHDKAFALAKDLGISQSELSDVVRDVDGSVTSKFTGTDKQGREWSNGVLLPAKRKDEAQPITVPTPAADDPNDYHAHLADTIARSVARKERYPTNAALLAAKRLGISHNEVMQMIDAERKKQASAGTVTPAASTPGRQALAKALGGDANLAAQVDEVVHKARPDDWAGNLARERTVKGAIYGVLGDMAETERIFDVVKANAEYHGGGSSSKPQPGTPEHFEAWKKEQGIAPRPGAAELTPQQQERAADAYACAARRSGGLP